MRVTGREMRVLKSLCRFKMCADVEDSLVVKSQFPSIDSSETSRPLATSSHVVGRFAAKRGSLRSPRGRFIASLTICHLYNLHVRTFYSHMRRASISFTKSTRTGKDANNYPSRWKESKCRLVLKFSSKMLNFSLLITLSCAIVGA